MGQSGDGQHLVFTEGLGLCEYSHIVESNARFEALQQSLLERWQGMKSDDGARRDIVIVPSLSLEGLPMANIPGVTHYEERMLFTLALLRHPRAHLVYVTSQPLHPAIVDYHLSLLQGIPTAHARKRLTLLSTYDASPRTLTEKILERPRLMDRIRQGIDVNHAHMTCFTVSELEARLAVKLGIPLYGIHPKHLEFGTKSGSRRIFREAGISLPPGIEGVRDEEQVIEAIDEVMAKSPESQRLVLKHESGFSGEGNAVFQVPGTRSSAAIRKALHTMRFTNSFPTWERFGGELARQGGVVEAFVEPAPEGENRAPSGQLRITPAGTLECVSTHDQLVGGPDGQTYQGCRFPADADYRLEVQEDALKVGEVLRAKGVIGRAAVDFVTRPRGDGTWERFAIEINLRMSGTTHPLMIMQMLNGGRYDPETGLYMTGRGEPRCYVASDSLGSERYRGLLVDDLLDIAAVNELHYRPWTDSGVVFHLAGALSEFGKVGITAIGTTPEEAQRWFSATRRALDHASSVPIDTMPPCSSGEGMEHDGA